jgi:RNA polymerase sigma-70 factor (ECF subfamily)
MVTVRRQHKEWLKGFESGADDYVSKPLNPPELIERVQACLKGEGARQGGGPEHAEFRLIRAARAGNRGAFDILVRHHQMTLTYSIEELVHNRPEAEDIVSCAFMTAFEHLGQFEGSSPFCTWVYKIALNELCDRRSPQRQPAHVSLDDMREEENQLVPKSLIEPDPCGRETERNPEHVQAQIAMNSIPRNYRRLLNWHIVKGMPCDRIGRRLRVPTGTVWSRVDRAKRMFRSACWRARLKPHLPG